MRQAHGWNNLDTEKLRGGDASMAGDDLAVVGDQHRIAETKALDRRRDLLNLSLAMSARVSRIGLKQFNRYIFDRWPEMSHAGHQN